MQDLRFTGVDEDGTHLLLRDGEGGRYRLELDEELRAAARRRPASATSGDAGAMPLRPRDVQGLIRAGHTAEEVAEQSGWDLAKIARYEAPIVAEREHVSMLARRVVMRGRSGGESATLEARVKERLVKRGVPTEQARWDAWRPDEGAWTVQLQFPAGGRQREGLWHYEPHSGALAAQNDEARWLSEDEGDVEAPGSPLIPQRDARVYDVEAEGGVRTPRRRRPVDEDLFPVARGRRHDDESGEDDMTSIADAVEERDAQPAPTRPVQSEDPAERLREASAARRRRSPRSSGSRGTSVRGRRAQRPEPGAPDDVSSAARAAGGTRDRGADVGLLPLEYDGAELPPGARGSVAGSGSEVDPARTEAGVPPAQRPDEALTGTTSKASGPDDDDRRAAADQSEESGDAGDARAGAEPTVTPAPQRAPRARRQPSGDATDASSTAPEVRDEPEASTADGDGPAGSAQPDTTPGDDTATPAVPADQEAPDAGEGTESPAPRTPAARKKGARTSVPSWDDIMFGSKR